MELEQHQPPLPKPSAPKRILKRRSVSPLVKMGMNEVSTKDSLQSEGMEEQLLRRKRTRLEVNLNAPSPTQPLPAATSVLQTEPILPAPPEVIVPFPRGHGGGESGRSPSKSQETVLVYPLRNSTRSSLTPLWLTTYALLLDYLMPGRPLSRFLEPLPSLLLKLPIF